MWQDIETAPKDGTAFVAFYPSDGEDGPATDVVKIMGGHVWTTEKDYLGDEEWFLATATLWTPLPT